MAATYQLSGIGIPLITTNESLLSIFNGAGSGVVVRVYRIWGRNTNIAWQVSGTQNLFSIYRITGSTASNYTIPLLPVDSSNAAVPAQVISGAKFTTTNTDVLRRVAWSNDDAILQGGTIDEIQTTNWTVFWDADYKDTNIEPLVLREGFGVSIRNDGFSATTATIDLFMECTIT